MAALPRKVQEPAPKNPKMYVKLVSFYNKHFPTDKKTFNYRIPVLSMVISILSLCVISDSVLIYSYIKTDTVLLKLAYLLLALGAHFELYWGLKIGDCKQFTPWLIFKALEILLIIAALGYASTTYYFNDFIEPKIVLLLILFFFQGVFLYIIISRLMQKKPPVLGGTKKGNEDNFPDFQPEVYENV